jgi:hypothetical protein
VRGPFSKKTGSLSIDCEDPVFAARSGTRAPGSSPMRDFVLLPHGRRRLGNSNRSGPGKAMQEKAGGVRHGKREVHEERSTLRRTGGIGVKESWARGWRQSSGVDPKGRGFLRCRSARRSSWASFRFEVVEDLSDEFGVDDECENFHPCPASGAGQRVDLVDAIDERGPSSARPTAGSCLVGVPLRLGQGGILRPAGCANAVGVGAVETAMYRDT